MNKVINQIFLGTIFLFQLYSAHGQSVQDKLNEVFEAGNYPGIVFSVVHEDGTVNTYFKGWANKEKGIQMNESIRMLSGSTGKTYVSAIIMQLLDEGKLSLNDHISNWFEGYDWFAHLPNKNDITLRDLLRHQSGLERYVFKPEFARDVHKDADKVWVPQELLSYILDEEPLFKAGEGFAYSDTNYILLGMVIEQIEGKAYYSSLKERLLEPLGLTETVPTNSRNIERLAQGYMEEEGPLGYSERLLDDNGVSRYNLQFEWTGGGLAFETRDFARWLKLLFEGNAFDMSEVGDEYFDPVASPEIGGEYGPGYQQITIPGVGKGMGHSGFFPGYFTIGLYFPDQKMSVAMQVNTSEMSKLKSFFPDFVALTTAAVKK